jgi:hypothetical protein
MLAIERDLPLDRAAGRDLEERVSRIGVSFARVVITPANIVRIAIIFVFAIQSWTVTHLDPGHLDVAHVIVAIARFEIEHGVLDGTGGRVRRDR